MTINHGMEWEINVPTLSYPCLFRYDVLFKSAHSHIFAGKKKTEFAAVQPRAFFRSPMANHNCPALSVKAA